MTYEEIWNEFSIAEMSDEKDIIHTFKCIFMNNKNDYISMTELVLVLQNKLFQYYKMQINKRLTELYCSLWDSAADWAEKHFTDIELRYYLNKVK